MREQFVETGRLVRILLTSGKELIDHFIEHKSRYVFLKEYGKLNKKFIKSMTVHTHQPGRETIKYQRPKEKKKVSAMHCEECGGPPQAEHHPGGRIEHVFLAGAAGPVLMPGGILDHSACCTGDEPPTCSRVIDGAVTPTPLAKALQAALAVEEAEKYVDECRQTAVEAQAMLDAATDDAAEARRSLEPFFPNLRSEEH